MVEVIFILISAYTDADLASLETLAREGTFVFIMHFANLHVTTRTFICHHFKIYASSHLILRVSILIKRQLYRAF